MTNSGNAGFWGYAHIDDKADGGRVTRLAQKIQLEYQALTTQEIDIFVDRFSLEWGEKWRERIDTSLQATTFYIPIITPSFFNSAECRREFLAFVNTAKSLGVEEYVLAIRYIPVPDLTEDSADDVKALVAATQYVDWEDLRFEDEDASQYRRAINQLAKRLVDLSKQVEARPAVGPSTVITPALGVDEDDDSPGLLDLIGDFEPAAQDWLETVNRFPPLLLEFNAALNEGSEELDAVAGKPFAYRVVALKKTAARLEPSTKDIEKTGAEYITKLLALDPPVRAMIELSKATTPGTEAEKAAKEQFRSIKTMAATSSGAVESLSDAGRAARKYANYSRDLRPAFRRFETGTRSIVDGQSVIDEWERLVDDSGLLEQSEEALGASWGNQ